MPEGKTAEDNLVVKLVESYTQLPENPLPHWELARKYDIIDFDLGVKLTGAGFPVYKGQASARDNCPTRRDRCTTPRRTTSTSFRRPKCP